MPGNVDVRETIEIACLLLLTVPSVPPPEKTSTLAVLLRSRSSEIVTIVKELRINISIDIGFEEGEKSDLAVLGSELLQSVRIANPPQLQEI